MGTCEGPYLVKVEGSLGTVYSLATNEDVGTLVNASPLTSLITSLALGESDLSQDVSAKVASITSSVISAKANIVKVILAPLLDEFNVGEKDLMKGAFSADGKGLDRVLDAISIAPKGTSVELKLKGTSAPPIELDKDTTETMAATAATSVSNSVTEASAAMNDLDALQLDITETVTRILRRSDVSAYCHADYLESGYRDCYDYFDEYFGEIKVTRPVILEKVSPDHYWVAFDLFEKDAGDPDFVLEFAGIVMQMKKTAGKWQFYGNQLEWDTEFAPTVIALNAGPSNVGYYFQMHEEGQYPPSFDKKDVSLKFLAESLIAGADVSLTGTLDEFGQLTMQAPAEQICDPDSNLDGYEWHCLKGFKLDGALFKSQFAKLEATYPNPSDTNGTPLTKSFYVQTPKGMNPNVPVVTISGTTEGVAKICPAEINSASWTAPGNLRLDYLDPIWNQGGNPNWNNFGLDDDDRGQSGERGDTEKTFTPPLKVSDQSFNSSDSFNLGIQATFNDAFERRYIRFATCQSSDT